MGDQGQLRKEVFYGRRDVLLYTKGKLRMKPFDAGGSTDGKVTSVDVMEELI